MPVLFSRKGNHLHCQLSVTEALLRIFTQGQWTHTIERARRSGGLLFQSRPSLPRGHPSRPTASIHCGSLSQILPKEVSTPRPLRRQYRIPLAVRRLRYLSIKEYRLIRSLARYVSRPSSSPTINLFLAGNNSLSSGASILVINILENRSYPSNRCLYRICCWSGL
jgi:hypothetical protein